MRAVDPRERGDGSQSRHHVLRAATEQYTQDAGRPLRKPGLESENILKSVISRQGPEQ